MKKMLLVVMLLVMLCCVGTSYAGNRFAFGLNVPIFAPPVVAPAPVAPAPVVVGPPAPVYVVPAQPVYVAPTYVEQPSGFFSINWFGGHHEGHHGWFDHRH